MRTKLAKLIEQEQEHCPALSPSFHFHPIHRLKKERETISGFIEREYEEVQISPSDMALGLYRELHSENSLKDDFNLTEERSHTVKSLFTAGAIGVASFITTQYLFDDLTLSALAGTIGFAGKCFYDLSNYFNMYDTTRILDRYNKR